MTERSYLTIALAKGELAKPVEDYLKSYGIDVVVEERPVTFVQRMGNVNFRPMRSNDVPRYVGGIAEAGIYFEGWEGYGITGQDFTTEYDLNNPKKIKVIKRLGFGEGDLVLFSTRNTKQLRKGLNRVPIVAVAHKYRGLVDFGAAGIYLMKNFDEGYRVLPVEDSVEGFVADGTADIGFGFTSLLRKRRGDTRKTTLEKNDLVVLENIMPTEAVVISKDSPEFNFEEFDRALRDPAGFEINGKTTAATQVA